MGAQTIQLSLTSDNPRDTLRAIELDDRWREAEKEGLLHRQVFADPDDPSKAELQLRWTSLEAAQAWQSKGEGLDFDGVELGESRNFVSAGRFA